MDISTLVGVIAGFVLISLAIVTGGAPALFFDTAALLIVFGGTTASTLVRFPFPRVVKMVSVVKNAFSFQIPTPNEVIEELVAMSRKTRKEGLLSLDNYPTDDPSLEMGLQLIVDGSAPEIVEASLETDIRYLQQRHKDGRDILTAIGEAAPAFGMIGTLIGLVQMLANMSDVKALGPAMAVAILTTLYGAIIANVVANPIAQKLEVRSREETLNRELRLAGLLYIQKGENPRMIETLLKAFLRKQETGEEAPPLREVKSA